MFFVLKILLFNLIFLVLDLFTVSYLKNYIKKKILYTYIGINLLLVIFSGIIFFSSFFQINEISQFATFTLILMLYIPKIIFLLLYFLDILFSLIKSIYFYINNKGKFILLYHRFNLYFSSIITYIFFVLYLSYGFFIGRTDYSLESNIFSFDRLPKVFDGFKIVQISDLHLGSFGGVDNLDKVVDIINKQEADIVIFTGDIVNQTSKELTKDYEKSLTNIKSKLGKFCVFGNHDYGGYFNWDNIIDSLKNIEDIKNFYNRIGFKLLDNKNVVFRRDTSEIHLLGVDNYSKKMKLGDLKKANFLTPKESFKILMSHNPYHFEEFIKNPENIIDLTLSGHTHGMQLGINFFGKYYSLMSLWNKRVLGLYEHNNMKIYVNRGLGVSMVMLFRAGMSPEITTIILKSK